MRTLRMKFLLETYTPLIKQLRNLNQEIRQNIVFTPSFTEQEISNLGKWLEEVREMVKELENLSLIISHHLNLLEIEYKEQLEKVTSKD